MILQDVGKPFDNATLERVRHIDTTVRRSPSKHSPMPAAARMMEAVEESVRVGHFDLSPYAVLFITITISLIHIHLGREICQRSLSAFCLLNHGTPLSAILPFQIPYNTQGGPAVH